MPRTCSFRGLVQCKWEGQGAFLACVTPEASSPAFLLFLANTIVVFPGPRALIGGRADLEVAHGPPHFKETAPEHECCKYDRIEQDAIK